MAQQTKSKASRTSSGKQSKPRSSSAKARTSRTRAKATRSSHKSGTTRTAGSQSPSRQGSNSSKSGGTITSAKDATAKRLRDTGDTVGSVAKKLRTPAIAAGAGLAGLAGGMALTRDRRKRALGVALPGRSATRRTSKNLAGAAKNVGALAERTGRVAQQVRVASEALDQNGSQRRSPVEVVLEGLTRRSQAAKLD